MSAKVLLAGYLGCGNIGDDAMMAALQNALPGSVSLKALSGSPEETLRSFGIPGVPRREMRKVEAAIAESHAVVFPGGSIFQDVTSIRSVAYYSHIVRKAKSLGKKVVLLSQGVGPLNSFFGRRLAVSALNKATVIAVRDPISAQALRDLKVTAPIRVTADLAWLVPAGMSATENETFGVGNMRAVGVAPRPLGKAFDAPGFFGEFCRLVFHAGMVPVLIGMDRSEDHPLIDEISKRQGGKVPDLRKVQTPSMLRDRIARLEAVVAVRLHAGVIAALVGVPPLMLNYDPKVGAFARSLECIQAMPLEGLTPVRLMEGFLQMLKDREKVVASITAKRPQMQEQAQQNVDILCDVLGLAGRRIA